MSDNLVRAASTVPTSASGDNAYSNAIYVGDMDPSTVVLSVVGTYTSTMQYQVSIDGTNYFQAGADQAGTGAVANSTNMQSAGSNPRACAMWARLKCSAFTSITAVDFVVAGSPL